MKRITYRFFLIVLLSVLAAEVFPVSAQEGSWFDEGNYDEEWLDKNFDNDVMIISTPEELAAFGEYMTRSLWNYPDKTVRLAADIDMSAHKWITPVNEQFGSYFSGVFDGDGYTISGLTVVPAEEGGGYDDDYKRVVAGLFGTVRGAEIRDLTLDETCRVEVPEMYSFYYGNLDLKIGTIAASAEGDVRFIRCVNRADIVTTPVLRTGDSHEIVCSVSGLVAHADEVKFLDCSNEGKIIVDIQDNSDVVDIRVSGLVGRCGPVYGKENRIVSCTNRGNIFVSGNTSGSVSVGGLSSNYTFRIDSCENHSVVKVNAHEGSAYVGGLVGKAYKLLWNSYSTGDVYSDVAGVKVCRLSESNVHFCYYNSDAVIEGTEVDEQGIAYSTAEMQSAGSGFLEALNNNATKGGTSCRNWGYIPGENDGYPVHIDRIADGVDSPADHSAGRVYAANGRLFVQSDRSMQLPVYKVTGQIVKIMNVVEGLNTDYLPCGVYVVAGQVVAVTAGNK